MQAERNPGGRSRIAMFPGQIGASSTIVNSERPVGVASRAGATAARRLHNVARGTPIDRYEFLAVRSGWINQAPRLQRSTAQFFYFLERLLKNVIFGEAMLCESPVPHAAASSADG